MIGERSMRWLLDRAGFDSLDDIPEQEYPFELSEEPGIIIDRDEHGYVFVHGPAISTDPQPPPPPPLKGTFRKLPDNSWGCLIRHDNANVVGRLVQLLSKSTGEIQTRRVKDVIRTYHPLEGGLDLLCTIGPA